MVRSKINPMMSLDYMIREHENKFFDRKSVKVKPSDLATHISAFANADGGTLVIGISDKSRKIEGISSAGEDWIYELINAPKTSCKPMPGYKEEFIAVEKDNGEKDQLLLLHIFPSTDQVIRTTSDETYLRIGDKSCEMKGDNLRNLEYTKGTRHFEDELNADASIDDLDKVLLTKYKRIIGAENISDLQVLKARGLVKSIKGREYLTNAAVLLFAENVQQFYPNCRIRFIRYEGSQAGVGADINIIRDKSIDLPILRIIEETKQFIATQLREFTALDEKTGKFKIIPEYPEFAWQEAIVNAVAHREYAMTGSYIKVSMYDDRLEIESPGKLPNIVTLENILETRYSRNPRISRILTEYGWVRELNEGVKRIYSDMAKFFLEKPQYSEPGQIVRLVLKNNIIMRKMRQVSHAEESIGQAAWESLDELGRTILIYMSNKKKVNRVSLEEVTGKAGRTITVRLNKMIEMGIVKRNGGKNDPHQSYELV